MCLSHMKIIYVRGYQNYDFFYFVNVFLLFCYLPWEKGGTLHLNKLEFPSSKDDLCYVWLNWLSGFGEKEFNFVNVFSICRYYLPLAKGIGLRLNKKLIPFTNKCFVPSLVEIDPVVLEKNFFLIWSMYVSYFFIISPCEKSFQFAFPFSQGCCSMSV